MSIHVCNQDKVKKLTELIGYYELCNRAEGKSPSTVRWYTEILTSFSGYAKNELHNNGMSFFHFTASQITEQHHKFSPMDRLKGKLD